MAARLHADVVWKGAAFHLRASNLYLHLPDRAQCLRPRVGSRNFSSSGTPILRNAASASSSTASSSSTTLDSVAAQTSDASISIFEPLVPYIYQLPDLLHLSPSAPHSYVISIIAATVVIRTCITLPITMWQRARMRRLEEKVIPRWEIMKRTLPETVARRSRRERKSYEEYEAALKKELKVQLRALTKQYNCTPALSIAVPVLVHMPIFIAFSLLLRTALAIPGSPISLETIPWWSPPPGLQEKFAANAMVLAERGIEGEALQKLTTIQGPKLSEVDKTMLAPIGLGVLTMANVEIGQWVRRGMTSEKQEQEKTFQREVEKQQPGGRADKGQAKAVEVEWTFRGSGVLGNILRSLAIGFVVISSQAPAGVVIYWLTSATYTFTQASVFALLDRQRIQKRRRI